MRVLVLLLIGLLLGAPATALGRPGGFAATYGGHFHVSGTEPFWDIHIRPGRMAFQQLDGERFTVTAIGPANVAGRARWTSRSGALVVFLRRGRCRDGMSDRVYAYTAEVRLRGRVLHGCAERGR